MTKRNRAPLSPLLATAFAAQDLRNIQEAHVSAPEIDDAIDAVRAAAERKNPLYGDLAKTTQFIDLDHITRGQKADMFKAVKKVLPHISETILHQGVDDLVSGDDDATQLAGTNIVLYKSSQLKGLSPQTLQFVFAHEVGHRIRETEAAQHPFVTELSNMVGKSGPGKGPRSEAAADHVGAEIVGAQNAVNALAEFSVREPETNDRAFQKREDKNRHGTNYARALKIQKDFPGENVDMSQIPKPTISEGIIAHPAPTPLPPHVASPARGP